MQSQKSRWLHLCGLGLHCVPERVFGMTHLTRLDVGHNELTELSSSVGLLVNLEELWINSNPLRALPSELEECGKLRIIDARDTALRDLPNELGRLRRVEEIDLRGTPFAESNPRQTTAKLVERLAALDARESLRREMMRKATSGVYREHAAECRDKLRALAAAVSAEFDDLDDLRDVVRNCDRLLPPDLRALANFAKAANAVRTKFVRLRRENDRKRLSAELELKLRALYYDRIDPAKVEGYIADVYAAGPGERNLDLEDIQFLIHHAPRLFPDDPEHIAGPDVRTRVFDLQTHLDNERAACVDALTDALLAHLYADAEPHLVADLAKNTCDQFKRDRFATKAELRDLKKLAADASLLFPPEFNSAKPHKIKLAFKRRQQADSSHQSSAS